MTSVFRVSQFYEDADAYNVGISEQYLGKEKFVLTRVLKPLPDGSTTNADVLQLAWRQVKPQFDEWRLGVVSGDNLVGRYFHLDASDTVVLDPVAF